jgi:hypothetical protein
MTAKPAGSDDPDLNAIGDNHMPEDLRQEERGESTARRDRPDSTETGDEDSTGDAADRDRTRSDPA